MNDVWAWLVANWTTIALFLVGTVSIIFVKYKGDLQKFALYVWAAALELAREGVDSVDQDVINALVDPIYDILVVGKAGPIIRLFLTKERLEAVAWSLWLSFTASLAGRAGDPAWNMYLIGINRARATLANKGKMAPARSRPFQNL